MAKKRRPNLKTLYKKINYNLILNKIKGAAHYVWRQTVVYNAVFTIAVILLFSLILSQAFKAYFNCGFLINQSLGMPSFMCTGQGFIPGLDSAMNGPLELIRRGMLWIVLFLFIGLSGFLTVIINNLKKVVKLITFDKQQWQELFSILKIFITILFLLNALFFIWIVF